MGDPSEVLSDCRDPERQLFSVLISALTLASAQNEGKRGTHVDAVEDLLLVILHRNLDLEPPEALATLLRLVRVHPLSHDSPHVDRRRSNLRARLGADRQLLCGCLEFRCCIPGSCVPLEYERRCRLVDRVRVGADEHRKGVVGVVGDGVVPQHRSTPVPAYHRQLLNPTNPIGPQGRDVHDGETGRHPPLRGRGENAGQWLNGVSILAIEERARVGDTVGDAQLAILLRESILAISWDEGVSRVLRVGASRKAAGTDLVYGRGILLRP